MAQPVSDGKGLLTGLSVGAIAIACVAVVAAIWNRPPTPNPENSNARAESLSKDHELDRQEIPSSGSENSDIERRRSEQDRVPAGTSEPKDQGEGVDSNDPVKTDGPTVPAVEPADGPIRVAKEGGVYTTIGEAISKANPEEEILIAPGTYREALVLDKNVVLRGEGARDEVILQGVDAPAIRIEDSADVTFTNMTLDAEGADINTVEVTSGRFTTNGVKLVSEAFDCVEVLFEASYHARDCDFTSKEHPAIVAKQAAEIRLEGCDFQFSVSGTDYDEVSTDDLPPISGIQLSDCGATIKGCKFQGIGRLGTGISCSDTDQDIVIAGCKFSGLERGIEVFSCSNVDVISLNVISDCQVGVYASQSAGDIQDLSLKNCLYGLNFWEESDFNVSTGEFEENPRVAVWLKNSTAKLEQCKFSENLTVAILVDCMQPDSQDALSKDHSLELTECELVENNIGMLLVGGSVHFDGGRVALNGAAGVAILKPEDLPEEFGVQASEGVPKRFLTAKGLAANAKGQAPAVLFQAEGTFQFEDTTFVDLAGNHRPRLADYLESVTEGGVTTVKRANKEE